jgi:hypothetical protein
MFLEDVATFIIVGSFVVTNVHIVEVSLIDVKTIFRYIIHAGDFESQLRIR